MRANLFWRSVRGRYLSVSLVTVSVSAGLVRHEWSDPVWPGLLAVLAGASLVHLGGNLWNDYADELNGTDRANLFPSPFNGGSRVIQAGELSAGLVRLGALACFGLAILLALLLVPRGGWAVPLLTVIGILLSLGYSSRPAWLSARGLGELTIAVCFGPLLGQGTALALTGKMSAAVFWATIPLGLLVAAILTINAIPDIQADRAALKRTLAVRRGPSGTIAIYRLLLLGAFVILAAAVFQDRLPSRAAVVLGAVPVAAWLFRRAGTVGASADAAFLRVAAATIVLHLTFGFLLIIGIW